MNIRTRIIIIGILAFAGLSLFLLDRYSTELARYRQQQQVAVAVDLTRGFCALVHALQMERGLTAGFLADPSQEQRAALLAQQARADREIAVMAEKDSQLDRIPWPLALLRERILAGSADHMEAHRAYSGLIQQMLDQVGSLARHSEHTVFKDDLTAHAHLMYAKEYLGRIRAMVNHALRTPADQGETTAEVARLQAVFEEYQRQFRRDAGAALLVEYERSFHGPEVDAALSIMRATAEGELAPPEIPADEWFRLASTAIDRLKSVEDRSMELTAATGDTYLLALRRRLLIHAAAALLLGSLTLALVAHTVRGMVLALDHLLGEIALIRARQDFATRIPLRGNDEIGVITRAFNELLEIADQMLREKDALAGTDQLTGLINRRRFMEFLDRELARCRRQPAPLSLIMFDIDHFKWVNDTYGHDAGDLVLGEMARLVGATVRRTDILARWGGEEFLVLLPDTAGEAAARFAEKLRAAIESHEFHEVGRVTASFGVACLDTDDIDGAGLIKHADQAMYAAKQGGRNRVAGP